MLIIIISGSNRIYSPIKLISKNKIALLITQYKKKISVVLVEQEAPNNLVVFRVKVLSVNLLQVSLP